MLATLTLIYTCWTLLGGAYDNYAFLEPGWMIVRFQSNADVFCRAPKIIAIVRFKGEVHLGFYGEYTYETTGEIIANAPRWKAAIVTSPALITLISSEKVLISPRIIR